MKNILIYFSLIFSLLQINCSISKYFTPVSSVKRDPQQQISDAEILKAFETKPQLVKPLTIALYGGGTSIKGFADSLKQLSFVRDVFEISPGIIEGDSYYQRRGHDWFDYYYQPSPINLSQLRLVAAQGKCDILIYCGVTHKYNQKPNYLAYSYLLLLTIAFVPGNDAELISNVDLFSVDVRNGFLYGTYTDQEVFRKDYVKISFEDHELNKVKEEQLDKMVPRLVDYVKELLSREEIYISSEGK
jgi:hypothetical protein